MNRKTKQLSRGQIVLLLILSAVVLGTISGAVNYYLGDNTNLLKSIIAPTIGFIVVVSIPIAINIFPATDEKANSIKESLLKKNHKQGGQNKILISVISVIAAGVIGGALSYYWLGESGSLLKSMLSAAIFVSIVPIILFVGLSPQR